MAMQLKEVTDRFKLMGADLQVLEERKQQAIAGEDFETAKAIKA